MKKIKEGKVRLGCELLQLRWLGKPSEVTFTMRSERHEGCQQQLSLLGEGQASTPERVWCIQDEEGPVQLVRVKDGRRERK